MGGGGELECMNGIRRCVGFAFLGEYHSDRMIEFIVLA